MMIEVHRNITLALRLTENGKATCKEQLRKRGRHFTRVFGGEAGFEVTIQLTLSPQDGLSLVKTNSW
jgi:hypothetical protein